MKPALQSGPMRALFPLTVPASSLEEEGSCPLTLPPTHPSTPLPFPRTKSKKTITVITFITSIRHRPRSSSLRLLHPSSLHHRRLDLRSGSEMSTEKKEKTLKLRFSFRLLVCMAWRTELTECSCLAMQAYLPSVVGPGGWWWWSSIPSFRMKSLNPSSPRGGEAVAHWKTKEDDGQERKESSLCCCRRLTHPAMRRDDEGRSPGSRSMIHVWR